MKQYSARTRPNAAPRTERSGGSFARGARIFAGMVAVLALASPLVSALSEDTDFQTLLDADDLTEPQSGGPGGARFIGTEGFSVPFTTLNKAHLREFVVGKAAFFDNWVAFPASVKSREGLGPVFNAQSCTTCHAKDGRGRPPVGDQEAMSSMLIRLSVPGKARNGGVIPVPKYGDQFNPRAIGGVRPEGAVKVVYHSEPGTYPDGTAYSLESQTYEFSNLAYGEFPKETLFSARVAPQTYGLGLLESVEESEILKRARAENPADPGAVSGRANWVWDVTKKKKRLGRFGWKANQPSLFQQNISAFLGDMGITSPVFPNQSCGEDAADCRAAPAPKRPELDAPSMHEMEAYVRFVAPPARRNLADPRVREGSALFRKVNCASCHTPTLVTGPVKDAPELSNQTIHPYTDLLLHDMGPGLADGRPDFEASGSEWRTPPLWGIGLFEQVNRHTRYLHDGRARSIEEAILWHGGEAARSRDGFMNLKEDDRKKLIRFLESI